MGSGPANEYNILLVDDDASVIAALGHTLQDFGRVRFACSGPEALRLAHQSPPDLILLDIELPGMSGFEVCAALKASDAFADIPVIFITGHDDLEHEVRGLQLGAADFITKPPRPPQVAARVALQLRLHEMNCALRKAAATDPLTGLANRRQFDETLQREWLRAQRAGSPLVLLMIDVDYFKAYNDHYGHQGGDQCLKAVARALRSVVHRPADLLTRYGGEEFAILLPETHAQGGCYVARYAQHAVRCARLAHARSKVDDFVTVSIGVSALDGLDAATGARAEPRPRLPATDLVEAADAAMYASKSNGRNQARFLRLAERGSPELAVHLLTSEP